MTKFLEPPLAVQYAWGIRYYRESSLVDTCRAGEEKPLDDECCRIPNHYAVSRLSLEVTVGREPVDQQRVHHTK